MTPRPDLSEPTARMYDGLPDLYAEADAQQAPPYPLARYLSLIGDVLADVDTVAAKLGAYDDDAVTLADPARADAAWLPWLAQLMGVDITGYAAESDRRAAMLAARSAPGEGTIEAIRRAARSALSPDARWKGYARVYRDAANPWLIHVDTLPQETPNPAAIYAATALVKPAGARITQSSYAATYATVQAVYTTYEGMNGRTWEDLTATPAP